MKDTTQQYIPRRGLNGILINSRFDGGERNVSRTTQKFDGGESFRTISRFDLGEPYVNNKCTTVCGKNFFLRFYSKTVLINVHHKSNPDKKLTTKVTAL